MSLCRSKHSTSAIFYSFLIVRCVLILLMAYQLRYNIRSNVHRSDEPFCLCTNPENDGGTYRDYGIITQVQPSEAMLSLGSVWNNTISIRKPTLFS